MKVLTRGFAMLLVTVLVIAALPTSNASALPGDLTPPVVSNVAVAPNPAWLGQSATVTATLDDLATGGSNIASAEFSLNGGAYAPMTASDGAFDSPTEAVTATFTPTVQGKNTVCVQGTDDAGNLATAVCLDFNAQSIYTFKGFMPPVRQTNKAQAGRNVPLKWKLTMTDGGAPVTDPSVILGVKSYAVDCTSLVGDPATAVSEKGPGNSGLKYQGNARWMFNWKTPKEYAGTCRMLIVSFSDGSTSPAVLFTFKGAPGSNGHGKNH